MRKPTIWVLTRSDTNRAVQSQRTVRGWKFWISKVVELYYLCSEKKGADQLCSYCEADLHLCFRLCRLLVFPCGGSNVLKYFITDNHFCRVGVGWFCLKQCINFLSQNSSFKFYHPNILNISESDKYNIYL